MKRIDSYNLSKEQIKTLERFIKSYSIRDNYTICTCSKCFGYNHITYILFDINLCERCYKELRKLLNLPKEVITIVSK